MPLTDDIARLTAIQVRQHQGAMGLAERLRATAGLDVGVIAKACGCKPSQVVCWERGEARPTTAQALAWLSVLYDHASGSGPQHGLPAA